jgi:ferredoxin
MDCVEVCPVDCFHEGDNMLVIDPIRCIDCGVCEIECPVEAIKADTEPGLEKWVEINHDLSRTWPVIRLKGSPPGDADQWRDVANKFEIYGSKKPGRGS